jgi:hypothetical protein
MAPRGRPPLIKESTAQMPVEITSAGLFSCSLKAEPKRDAISDSISAFENVALMFITLMLKKCLTSHLMFANIRLIFDYEPKIAQHPYLKQDF